MASTFTRPRQLFQLVLVIIVGLTLTWFATIESIKVARADQVTAFQREASLLADRVERAIEDSADTVDDIATYSLVDGALDRELFMRLVEAQDRKVETSLSIALAEIKNTAEGPSLDVVETWQSDAKAGTQLSALSQFSDIDEQLPLAESGETRSLVERLPLARSSGESKNEILHRLLIVPLNGAKKPLVVLALEPFTALFSTLENYRHGSALNFVLHAVRPDNPDSFAATVNRDSVVMIDAESSSGAMSFRHKFPFAGTDWFVDIWPAGESMPLDYSGAFITASAVLLMTSLVIFIIYSQVERSGRVVEIVDRRTRALKDAHAELEDNYRMLQKLNFDLDDARRNAETANEAKSEFLATVSHELRTPLNAILGFSQLLKDQALGDMGDKRYVEYSHDIHDSGEHLLQLINDILDLAKLEAGKIQLERRPVDIIDMINSTMHLMTHAAQQKNLTFNRKLGENFPEHVMGDLLRLRQIMLNLVSNAIKFTDKGEITIHLRLSTLSSGQESYVIEVEDTGIGIPSDKLPALFERFSQVDAKRSRKHGGAGLGLAICNELVSLMKGSIEVRSEVGKGTSFIVYLPLERADATVSADDDDAGSDFI